MKKKKSLAGQLLLYLSTVLAVFITLSGIVKATSIEGFFLQVLFLPITLFLVKSSIDQLFRKKPSSPDITFKRSKSFFATSAIIFFLLMFIGIRSVARSMENQENEMTTVTLDEDNKTIVVDTTKDDNKKILIIKADNPKALVNIREEPSDISPIINQARVGQEFEYISTNDNWYEIKVDEETVGWIKTDNITTK